MPDPREAIADLEAEIEDLCAAADRCLRTMFLAKIALLVGLLLLGMPLVGLIRFQPLLFVIGVSGALGGTALFGSTRSTRDQIIAAVGLREAQRAEMIDRLALQEVGAG